MKTLLKILITALLIITLPGYLFPAGNGNIQAMFEQGIEAFKSGNYGSSELLLRKVTESDDLEYKDKAWYYLALSIFNQKKYKAAIFEFNRFLSSCTTLDLCSMGRYWVAESYYLQNDYIRAIQEFDRFISQSKNEDYKVQAYDRKGRIYFLQSRYDEAIIEWNKALEKCDDENKKNQKRLNIGEAYFLNNNYEEAINFLKPLLNPGIDSKTMSMARLITGRAYQIENKHALAIKTFAGMDETLLTESPYNEVQYYRGISYIALSNLNFASLHLKTFLSTGKDSKWIYNAKFELAKIYLKENNIKDAVELLEDIRKSKAESRLKSMASMELAKIYFDTNIDESIKCLNEASGIDSADEKKEALILLSKAYIKIRNFKEAESILQQLITDHSFDKNADQFQFLLATVYFEEGEFEKAINELDKFKELYPFSKYINESYYYLGMAKIKNNRADDAIDLLNKYIALPKAEKKYNAYVMLLDLYASNRNFRNADKIMAVIIKYYLKEKGVEEVLYRYAMALSANNKPIAYYHNIILKNFNKSVTAGLVLLGLGDGAYVKKAYKEAEYYYRQYLAVQWRDNAASVFLYRIKSLDQLGMHKEIISSIENKDIPPMDEFTSKQLSLWSGRSYYNTGEYKKAYDSYSNSGWRLIDLPESDLSIMVKASVKIDDIITARKVSDLIYKNKNLRAESHYDIGLYYISKNNYDNARHYLNMLISETSNGFTDMAKAELADIDIKEEKYEAAVSRLMEIKSDKLQIRKTSQLIIAYFRSGNSKEASALTQKNINELAKSPYGETALKENLIYHYSNKNINEYNKYAQYLIRYPGNNPFINYHYAKLYYDNNSYKTSYFYFYKLSDIESDYRDESNYHLGLISLLVYKDKNTALKYFKKISENINGNKFAMQGRIELSVLSSELGNIDLSKKVLFDIMNNSENRLFQIQAENLIEYFGYKSGLQ